MSITLINNNPRRTGVGRYAYSLYEEFIKMDAPVSFHAWDTQLFNETFYRLSPFGLNWLIYILKFKRLTNKLEVKDKLVHVTNTGYLASVMPTLRMKGVNTVVTVHDVIPRQTRDSLAHIIAGKTLENVALADGIICVSKFTQECLFKTMIVKQKSEVIYNGVDHDLFRPRNKDEAKRILGLPKDKSIILNVGSEEPRKNLSVLFKVFSTLLNRGEDIVLIRIGSRTNKMSAIIKSLGIEDKILYATVPDSILALYYCAADVYVHPAYHEDFGLPVLEAMASGCPVLVSDRGALPEVVGSEDFIVDPFDVEGIADRIQQLLYDIPLRAELVEKCINHSLHFSWDRCAIDTLNFYNKIMS